MKNYYAFEIALTQQGNPLASEDNNFARKAAIEHRIAKASWTGEKPNTYQDPHNRNAQKTSASNFLGAGTFKKVFSTPMRPGAPGLDGARSIEFILAKLDCGRRAAANPWDESRDAIDDMVKNMVLYGQGRSTLYSTFEDNRIPRMYLYLPQMKGKELAAVTADPGIVDVNLRIRYFIDLARELRALHTAGFFHADLKPANIMADPVAGASLIDFGGVKRCWHPYNVRTPAYCICDPNYEKRLAKAYQKKRGKSLPSNYTVAFKVILKKFASKKHELRPTEPYRTQRIDNKPWCFGPAYDLAALCLIALELGLWDATNETLFNNWIGSHFNGVELQPILQDLRGKYSGAESLDGPVKLNVLSLADGVQVIPAAEPGVEPTAVRDVIRSRYQEKIDFEVNQSPLYSAQDHAQEQEELVAVDESFEIFKRFSSVTHVYKQADLDKGKSVDTKGLVLTQLINSLTYLYNSASIRTTLTKIYAVSLVNRSFFGRSLTDSFNHLFAAAKDDRILPLMQKHFDALLQPATTAEEFHERVLLAAKGLVPPQPEGLDLGREGSYGKGDRHEVINMIMAANSARIGPQGRAEARARATRLAQQNQQDLAALAKVRPMMSTLLGSQQKHTASIGKCRKERESIVSQIQEVFGELHGGATAQDMARFRNDLNVFYGP